jgi:hypothetical protein
VMRVLICSSVSRTLSRTSVESAEVVRRGIGLVATAHSVPTPFPCRIGINHRGSQEPRARATLGTGTHCRDQLSDHHHTPPGGPGRAFRPTAGDVPPDGSTICPGPLEELRSDGRKGGSHRPSGPHIDTEAKAVQSSVQRYSSGSVGREAMFSVFMNSLPPAQDPQSCLPAIQLDPNSRL